MILCGTVLISFSFGSYLQDLCRYMLLYLQVETLSILLAWIKDKPSKEEKWRQAVSVLAIPSLGTALIFNLLLDLP